MRLANIDEWEIPKCQNQKKFRRTHYAMTPEGTESETKTSDSESEGPEARLAKKYRKWDQTRKRKIIFLWSSSLADWK